MALLLLLFLFDHCYDLTRMIPWYWNCCQNSHTSCYTSKHLRTKKPPNQHFIYMHTCIHCVCVCARVCTWHSLKRLPTATGILSLTCDEWRKRSKRGCCSGLFTFSGIRFLHAIPPPPFSFRTSNTQHAFGCSRHRAGMWLESSSLTTTTAAVTATATVPLRNRSPPNAALCNL